MLQLLVHKPSKEQPHRMVQSLIVHIHVNSCTAYYLDPATAQHLLDILQPIQVGYGAVLLSFLGAIHWGLEFAGMGGHLVPSPPLFHPSLTKGFSSILSGNSCTDVSLANNPSAHKLRLDYTIPRLHRNVLR